MIHKACVDLSLKYHSTQQWWNNKQKGGSCCRAEKAVIWREDVTL